MLEFIFELVAEFFGDVLLQVVLEFLAEFGCRSMENSFRPAKRANPFFAGCGLLLLGALVGLLAGLILPDPLFPHRHLPGISLVLAPVGVGTLMHLFGAWRRKKGGNPTCLATFWGGACFAFGMALVRWLMIRYS